MKVQTAVYLTIGLAAVSLNASSQVVRQGTGIDQAALQAVVDQHRNDLGVLRSNTPGSFGSGRREINWDGAPDSASSPNAFPGDFFNGTTAGRARGALFTTPGTGFEVSGRAGTAPIDFDNINPTYSTEFTVFSPQRLFTAIGSNITDVTFFIPGTTTSATVHGFGSVFTDVDLSDSTRIEFYDVNNTLLFSRDVLPLDKGLSFLGVTFNSPIVSRVRLISGNSALGAAINDGGAIDVVAMDDFFYGEPVPEPSTLVTLVCGAAPLLARFRKRKTE